MKRRRYSRAASLALASSVGCALSWTTLSCTTEVTVHLLGDGPISDAGVSIDPSIEAMHVRADQALSSLLLKYWATMAANTTTYDFEYAIYWDALFDAAERRGPNAFSGTAKMFFELQAKRGWQGGDYSDESWTSLVLLHGYRVTHDPLYLDQAKSVYADIMSAWDTTCCGANPGGLWWKKAVTSGGTPGGAGAGKGKIAAVNSAAVISGARLYEATNDPAYLSFARQVFDYWSKNMVDPETGHVYESIQNDGTIDKVSHATDNEGLFIGATLALAQATGDLSHMPLAHQVAKYMMSAESEGTSLGTILSDGKCSGAGEMSKAAGTRYLAELYAADPTHTEYRDFLHRSADALWTLALDLSSGDISCDWAGPYDSASGGVDSLGAAAVALAAVASALGPATLRPPLQYEAEEGDLHGIGIGNDKSGFSGWGYVVGWGSDGQSIDFLVVAPAAGQYGMTMHYAAGGDAKRALRVNGALVDGSVAFPSTGGYDKYTTVSRKLSLIAGGNTVTIAFANAQASAGYVNLDLVAFTPP